jgi:Uncharacterized conserved protein, contains double-stranded beta-helix domain
MATVFKSGDRDFQEDKNKADNFRLMTDVSRIRKGVKPQNLNFDLRQLNPGQFSAPYHSHRFAEELFMILTGSMTLRTPEGLETVSTGDLIFFEMGDSGAHQFYNHTDVPCIYLDIRSSIGYDVCDYPDSNKVLLAPTFEIFSKDDKKPYFEGETHILEVWKKLRQKDSKE